MQKSLEINSVEAGINIESFRPEDQPCVRHIQRIKFPQELFPESRLSRKGFMRTRWLFNEEHMLDLVNIHLFHDASNLVAMEATPSPYAQNRQRALEFTLNKVSEPLEVKDGMRRENLQSDEIPMFIFGDFNFRLDANKVIERITEGALPEVKRCATSNEILEFVYHLRDSCSRDTRSSKCSLQVDHSKSEGKKYQSDANKNNIATSGESECSNRVIMTIGKKLFDCENLDELFSAAKNTEWLQEMDNELDSFKSKLLEFRISFSPSYPFKEDTTGAYSYMKTRCPAWCDRILFNPACCKMIYSGDTPKALKLDSERRLELLQDLGDAQYGLMGSSSPMGDHKPVLLYCRLNVKNSDQKIVAKNIQRD